MRQKFYICENCGRIAADEESYDHPVCCGRPMRPRTANLDGTVEELHHPSVKIADSYIEVSVGNDEHPMTTAHSIKWISLITSDGERTVKLDGRRKPEARFMLNFDRLISVFAYCSVHGLWKYDF